MLIIGCAFFVPILDMSCRGLGVAPMLRNDPIHPVPQSAEDEDVEAVLPIPQNRVGAASHDDTGLLFRQLLDELRLVGVDLVRQAHGLPVLGAVLVRGVAE